MATNDRDPSENKSVRANRTVKDRTGRPGRRPENSRRPENNRPRGGSRGRRLIIAVLASATLAGATGCSLGGGIFRRARRSDFCDEIITKYQNRVMAEKAWLCRRDGFGVQADNDIFKAGFIDGYLDIAEGGDGCTPLVAPRQYWGWRYQTSGGRNAAGSWFAGYPFGVQAAEEDGLYSFRQIATNPRTAPAVQRPGDNPFIAPGTTPTDADVPAGFHRHPDGTLHRNGDPEPPTNGVPMNAPVIDSAADTDPDGRPEIGEGPIDDDTLMDSDPPAPGVGDDDLRDLLDADPISIEARNRPPVPSGGTAAAHRSPMVADDPAAVIADLPAGVSQTFTDDAADTRDASAASGPEPGGGEDVISIEELFGLVPPEPTVGRDNPAAATSSRPVEATATLPFSFE